MDDPFEFDEGEFFADVHREDEEESDEEGETSDETRLHLLEDASEEVLHERELSGTRINRSEMGMHADDSTQPWNPVATDIHASYNPAAQACKTRQTPELPDRHVKLGASAPINIPSIANWRNEFSDSDTANPAMPQTFVPPHQLLHKDASAFSFYGTLPRLCSKREQLARRDEIWRSTGFIDGSPRIDSFVADITDSALSGHTGGLTAAFGSTMQRIG